MKTFQISSLALAVASVGAFPALMTSPESPFVKAAIEKRQSQGAGALPAIPPPFDAKAQRISTKGKYKFVAPGPMDMRGECPGLNAMANHGYLPHNGVATIQQFEDATRAVFGMAPDLGGFLANYGALVDGTGFGWSIGGGPHVGIGGSHGNYETDSSPLKSDLNQYGSLGKLIMSQFYTLYNMQPDAATANYNLEVMRAFRGKRYQESIDKNPFFTYNPFAGIQVSQAAFTFVYRFMSNKSAENPEGILNKDVLKSFMSITGPEDSLMWTFGHERIPDNWYKRNPSDEYSIPYFQSDVLYFAETQPEILQVGCNQGKVDSFNSISPEIITNGAITAADVAMNPFCYSNSFGEFLTTSVFGTGGPIGRALVKQFNAFGAALGVTCPKVKSFNTTVLMACPGASLYGGPMGPVAPGAIQS